MQRFYGLCSLLLIGLSVTFTNPAAAQGVDTRPKISLQVSASRDVPQDTLRATLSFQARQASAVAAQADVNRAMQRAQEAAGKVSGVKFLTGHYSTYEDRRERVWIASQSVHLEGKDGEAVLMLSRQLQEMGFGLNGLGYFLSAERQRALTDTLIAEALATARQRADKIVQALGAKAARPIGVRHHESGGGGMHPQPFMRAMAMESKADMAMPVATADETQVSVAVEVDFLLVD